MLGTHRHREERQQYRTSQYFVQAIGRRKISKAARAQAELEKRDVLEGSRMCVTPFITLRVSTNARLPLNSAYNSEIVARRGLLDPERTNDMALTERALIASLNEQEATFKSVCREYWLVAYVDWVQRRIGERVQETLDTISSFQDRSLKRWDQDTVENIHEQRRIIAGYHQELELCSLEDRIYEQITRDNMYILEGAWCVISFDLNALLYLALIFSVNRSFFKHRYKF